MTDEDALRAEAQTACTGSASPDRPVPQLPGLLETDKPTPPKHCSFLYDGAHWEVELVRPERWLLTRRGTRICVLRPVDGAWKGCSLDEGFVRTRIERSWTDVLAAQLSEVAASSAGRMRSRDSDVTDTDTDTGRR